MVLPCTGPTDPLFTIDLYPVDVGLENMPAYAGHIHDVLGPLEGAVVFTVLDNPL